METGLTRRFDMRFHYLSRMHAICLGYLLLSLALEAMPTAAQQTAEYASPSAGGASPAPVPAPIPIASSYIVGEADVLRITVWKQPEISQPSVVVRPDGMISVPLVGEIKVSGMTPVQIEATLVEDLKQYVNEPRVTVTVAEVGSKTVYVTGEVEHPGAYPLVGPVDVLQIIAKAGGVTPYARRRSVFVLRQVNGKKEKVPVNYSRIFRGKNPEQNINLQPGDTVVVP
jgi:polysaccharide biosynthesis/export protein